MARSPRLERRSPITRPGDSDRTSPRTPSTDTERDISRDSDRARPDVLNARPGTTEDIGSSRRPDSSRSPRTTVQPDADSGPIRRLSPENESRPTRTTPDRLADRTVDRNLDRSRDSSTDSTPGRSPRVNRDSSPRDGAVTTDRRNPAPNSPDTGRDVRSLRDRAVTREDTETASIKPESLTRKPEGPSPFSPRVETSPLGTNNMIERSLSRREGSTGNWRSTTGESLPIRSATELMNWKDRGSRLGNLEREKHGYSDGWSRGGYSDPWSRRRNWGDRDHWDRHYGYSRYCGPYYPAYYAPVLVAPVVPLYPYYPYYPSSGFSFSVGSFGGNGFFSLSFGSSWPAYYGPTYYPTYYPRYIYDPFYYDPRPNVTIINNYYGDYYRRPYYDSYYSRSSYRTTSYSYSETYYRPGYTTTTSYYDYSPGYSRYEYTDYGYAPEVETVTYYDDAYGYSFTEFVRSRRPYAYRPVVERHVYYYGEGPRSYTRHRPTRFYFFTDLGDYRERSVPEYVEVRQRSYREEPVDVREATDPLGRAYALFAAKDYYAAIISFDDAIRKSPKEDGVVYFARAQAFFAIGDYRSAYNDIVRGMELIPDWGQIQINMYEFYDDKDEFETQLTNLKDWTERRPDDMRALVTLGYVQYFLQDYTAAKSCLVRALAADRDNPVAKRFLQDVIRREADIEAQVGGSSEARRTS